MRFAVIENSVVINAIIADSVDIAEKVTGFKCVASDEASPGYSYDPIDEIFIAPMPECGHDELLLNALKRWECKTCQEKIRLLDELSD
tara:strand:+ start:154 stop:417 length:264 start_codon:yes stop_codon:yes gene_type:complete